MTVTPVYAGLIALFFVFLSFRVIGQRRAVRVALGDGGDRLLMRRSRAHANFAEYVPLTILLMALAELQAHPAWTLHLMGTMLIAGRLTHAFALSREPEVLKLRVVGMSLTFIALITAALTNLGFGDLSALLDA